MEKIKGELIEELLRLGERNKKLEEFVDNIANNQCECKEMNKWCIICSARMLQLQSKEEVCGFTYLKRR